MDKSKILTSNAPVAREVKFSDGTTETVHFRQVSAGIDALYLGGRPLGQPPLAVRCCPGHCPARTILCF
ncbi:hypothetical protein, partial [Klebsiella pneumoniae]|uniref:hypothetical protein n=1 Tax=Klebsiella pneumoniae TaxID=573 RepID=UPI0037C087F7